MGAGDSLQLGLRSQALSQDDGGHSFWKVTTTSRALPVERTAMLLCDMWDKHWSRGASERVDAMAPRMNRVVAALRGRGVQIIHAPSETLGFYKDSPALQRVKEAPAVEPYAPIDRSDPPLPIDDSDGGSDTGETPWHQAWTRQHPAIEIDQDRDALSDNGREIYGFMQERGIRHLLIAGVHTNMCVLGRSFGIRQMVRWGMDVALIRDLTDTMYNPAMRPYVDHDEGTRLVVEYIEKFWCPTIDSSELA